MKISLLNFDPPSRKLYLMVSDVMYEMPMTHEVGFSIRYNMNVHDSDFFAHFLEETYNDYYKWWY